VGKGAAVAVNTTVGFARDGRTEVATVVGLAQAVITNISMRRHAVSRTKVFLHIFFILLLKTLTKCHCLVSFHLAMPLF